MNPVLFKELSVFFLYLAASAIAGYLLDSLDLFLMGCTLYLYIRLLYRQLQLKQWIEEDCPEQQLPETENTIINEIYYRLFQKKREHIKSVNHLTGIIERAKSSIVALDEGIVLIDKSGNLEWWNPSASELLKLKNQDKDQPVTNFLRDPRFVNYFKSGNFKEPLDIPSPWNHGQQLQFEITTFGENDRLLICWDTTILRNLENMRKEFVANVSHELRTPLTVFLGYLETMADNEADLPEAWIKALRHMQAQAKRMTHIVNDLLTLSRLESTQQKKRDTIIDIPLLINEIRSDALIYGADKHQNIEMDIDDRLLLNGNSEDIRSAFMNLVTNAIKYSPEKSIINLHWYQTENTACFSVKDQGHGIDAQHIPRLTERFYRIDVSRSKRLGGTGLGLAIVKHVLINHQGQLKIESTPGLGSTFTVIFDKNRFTLR